MEISNIFYYLVLIFAFITATLFLGAYFSYKMKNKTRKQPWLETREGKGTRYFNQDNKVVALKGSSAPAENQTKKKTELTDSEKEKYSRLIFNNSTKPKPDPSTRLKIIDTGGMRPSENLSPNLRRQFR